MLDRQDIDALLVGALYGELSSTDQERLNAHLAAHPGDRNALDDLKSAQQVIRTKLASSRIFELQLDPPQAISAQLLQAAARRAPKMKPVDAIASEGWFARFVHAFVAHPAMAAAATLVLVVGVAGSIYLRTSNNSIIEPTVGQLATPTSANQEVESSKGAAAGSATEGVAVALAEDKLRDQAQTISGGARGGDGVGGAATGKPGATPAAVAKPARHAVKAAAYVRTDDGDLQPKDLDEATFGKNAKSKKDEQVADRRASAQDDVPYATSPAKATTTSPRAGGPGDALGRPGASANGSVAAAPPPPPSPAPVTKAPDSNYAWAKDQHVQVAALVKAGKCQEAAPLAVAIKSRDPDYYNSFVATDRALKPCMQYVTEAADREAEQQRAKTRVNAEKK